MTRSHGRATVHNFPDFAQNLEICRGELNKYALLTIFRFFWEVIHIWCELWCNFINIFLQKIQVLTEQENQHLKCLALTVYALKYIKSVKEDCNLLSIYLVGCFACSITGILSEKESVAWNQIVFAFDAIQRELQSRVTLNWDWGRKNKGRKDFCVAFYRSCHHFKARTIFQLW